MFTDLAIQALPMEDLLMPAEEPSPAPAGHMPQRAAWFGRASSAMPYGVSSNFRYWGDEDTMIVARGKGARIWDVDGNEYLDYRLGFGPVILGHAFDEVTRAVTQAMQDGNSFALTNIHEVRAAERFKRLTGVDKVRFTNSGAESTMHALRIARAHTGREKIIKFEGAYHGAHDYVMWTTSSTPVSALGSRRSPNPVATSSGIPKGINQYIIPLPWNNFEILEHAIKDHAHDVAAILVEPIMGNLGGLMPAPGWLQHIRNLCDAHGVVLIFDEVKTGFRVARGGAQELFGIRADLVAYAKAMGNGFPIGAIGGKEEFMMTIEPGAVGQGGTYCGNVVSAAACEATLRVMEEQDVFGVLAQRGNRLMAGLSEILSRRSIPHVISGAPALFGILLGADETTNDYRSISKKVDKERYNAIAARLKTLGVLPDPDFEEPWFLSYSHTEQDIDETLQKFEDAAG
ncbi:MAG TPA: guanitoxin biosynthesis PLP-dependent transaminase GntE [Thermoflexales bacterium]|nr:guanitoxin biosynthesis PLP-dependent transaminase GntE [Thermoflexales bacterium]